jgi:hypothetical protein
LFYAFTQSKLKEEQVRFQHLKQQKNILEANLKDIYPKKFINILTKNKPTSYSRFYYDFWHSLPPGYLIDTAIFEKGINDQWNFQGTIYPEDPLVSYQEFRRTLSFSQAKIMPVIFNKILGQKIILNIKEEKL